MSDRSVDDRHWFAYNFSGIQIPHTLRYVRIRTTSIPDGAFAYCQRLTEVQFHQDNEEAATKEASRPKVWKIIGTRAFHQCIQLQTISIPPSTQQIGDRAFEECRSLKACDLPQDLIWMGKRAFRRCESLQKIALPPLLEDVSSFCFQSCIRLKVLSLPVGLKVIRDYAFHGCVLLENFVVPNTVVEIGISAFERCKAVARIRIPMSTKRIGDSAFAHCRGLKTVEMPENHSQNGGFYLSVKESFAHCTDLRNIFLPEAMDFGQQDNIESTTTRFKGCVLLHKALKSEISPDTVTVDDIVAIRFGREGQDGEDAFQMHKLCYYQSHCESTTELVQRIEDMAEAVRHRCGGNHDATITELMTLLSRPDSVGMTPMHILVMSSVPRIEMLRTMVNLVPQCASILIHQKDVWGMTPLDCIKFQNELFEFTMGVLRLAIIRRVGFLGLESQREALVSLLDGIDPERPVQRRRQIIEVLQQLAHFERTEAVCLVEQAVWKQKFSETASQKEEKAIDETYQGVSGPPGQHLRFRELCRLNCGADIVITNTLPFLGEV